MYFTNKKRIARFRPWFFILVFLTLGIVGFKKTTFGGYHAVGVFPSQVEGENQALAHLVDHHYWLPWNGLYKVLYHFPMKGYQEPAFSAIWYDVREQELGWENDVHSGMVYRWKDVDRAKLEKLVRAQKGIMYADSIATRRIDTTE